MADVRAERPLWRYGHRRSEPMHLMRSDDEYVAVCNYSFEHQHSMGTLHPQLHDDINPRCPDCVALLAQAEAPTDPSP